MDDGIRKAHEALVMLAVEAFRFSRTFERATSRMEAAEQARFASQARYFMRKVDDALAEVGLSLVSVDDEPFSAGMAVSALNLGDFEGDDHLVIDQTLEPIVIGPEGLVRTGVVIVRKVEP